MKQHGQEMGTLGGTRLNMCLKPQQTAQMNKPHCNVTRGLGGLAAPRAFIFKALPFRHGRQTAGAIWPLSRGRHSLSLPTSKQIYCVEGCVSQVPQFPRRSPFKSRNLRHINVSERARGGLSAVLGNDIHAESDAAVVDGHLVGYTRVVRRTE